MEYAFFAILGILVGLGSAEVADMIMKRVRKPAELQPLYHLPPPATASRARPVDPENPPRYVVYARDKDCIAEICTCHSRPLQDGETFLYWPLPAELLCEETYKGEGR